LILNRQSNTYPSFSAGKLLNDPKDARLLYQYQNIQKLYILRYQSFANNRLLFIFKEQQIAISKSPELLQSCKEFYASRGAAKKWQNDASGAEQYFTIIIQLYIL
jgi:hypothetical protein